MIHAKIRAVSQELSFETGELMNNLVLELPNGTVIRSAISEQVAAELTAMFMQAGGRVAALSQMEQVPTAAPPVHEEIADDGRFSPLKVDNPDQTYEFGGDFSPPSFKKVDPAPPHAAVPVPLVPNLISRASAQVGTDDQGYPVLRGAGVVDTQALFGGNTDYEEDAGQLT